MEIRGVHQPEATSSSGASITQSNAVSQNIVPESTSETRITRSSARVRAAKQKAAQLSAQSSQSAPSNQEQEKASSSATIIDSNNTHGARIGPVPVKFNRSRNGSTAKGKGKEVLQESSHHSKRLVPVHSICLCLASLIPSMLCSTRRNPLPLPTDEPIQDPKGKKRAAPEPSEEESAGPSTKRPKTSGNSLRSITTASSQQGMTLKSRLVN